MFKLQHKSEIEKRRCFYSLFYWCMVVLIVVFVAASVVSSTGTSLLYATETEILVFLVTTYTLMGLFLLMTVMIVVSLCKFSGIIS